MRENFVKTRPDFPLLSVGDLATAGRVLSRAGVPGEVVRAEKAGEGNMNLTLRVTLAGGRTVILKQSRPWVEKYDFIAAPGDRANVEAAFYRLVAADPDVAGKMPGLLGHDPASCAIALQDLGAASDLTSLYRGDALGPDETVQLGAFLRALHELRPSAPPPANHDMRALNHAHIFHLPLAGEAPLSEQTLDGMFAGLGAAARALKADTPYRALVATAGEAYLASAGGSLLHGDFFPGSLLRTPAGVRVIDPEFTFPGPGEFDVGVLCGHLALARQGRATIEALLHAYGPCDEARVARTAGIEIMRRLIGVAQLPLAADLDRVAMLGRSRRAVLTGDLAELTP